MKFNVNNTNVNVFHKKSPRIYNNSSEFKGKLEIGNNSAAEFDTKFINKLSKTGLKRIEVGFIIVYRFLISKLFLCLFKVTSFVSPKWVPQLADAKEVMSKIERDPSIRYSVLTPNMKVRN